MPRNEVGLWNRSTFQFGDWLDPLAPQRDAGAATTHKLLVADACLVRTTEQLAELSEALGFSEEAANYTAQHAQLLAEFQNAWISSNGSFANVTQTALTLALAFGLTTNEDHRVRTGETLRQVIADNNYLVGTGFAGTQHLGPALASINATTDFYRMLLQTRVLSWLYQVVMGGTTTWERWDSMLPNGTINGGSMTSFNHYAFGSVASFMHSHIGSISPLEPGWKKIKVAPVPGARIESADARYLSAYGEVGCRWWIERRDEQMSMEERQGISRGRGFGFYLQVTIPPNSRAEITLPGSSEVVEVGSGFHEYFVEGYEASE